MSRVDHHAPLSNAAAAWLMAVAHPAAAHASRRALPDLSEVGPVLHAATLHGVLPAVLAALRGAGDLGAVAGRSGSAAEVDAANKAIAAARAQQVHQTGLELMLRHHGERVVKALGAAGIAAAILKGPVFARRLYREPAMRTFTDIDIIMPRPTRGAVIAIMRDLGFAMREHEYRAGKDYSEDSWQLASEPRVSIELHVDLVHNPKLRRRASVTLGDVADAGGGDTEDATAILLVAAAHGAVSHQFDRLQHLVDVALAAEGAGGAIDGGRLSQVARNCGVLGAVHAGLTLAGAAFGSQACRALAEKLSPSTFERLASGLVTPRAVVTARSSRRSSSSWRRKALRQVIRLGGRPSPMAT
jgi:hypothetical protein